MSMGKLDKDAPKPLRMAVELDLRDHDTILMRGWWRVTVDGVGDFHVTRWQLGPDGGPGWATVLYLPDEVPKQVIGEALVYLAKRTKRAEASQLGAMAEDPLDRHLDGSGKPYGA